jgi:IMP dehydrogenase
LIGIVTGRDIRFELDPHKLVREVMTSQVITATTSTSPHEAVAILQKHRIEKLPILAADGSLKGMFTVKDIVNAASSPSAAKDEQGRLLVAAAISGSGDFLERAQLLLQAGADALVIDTAHGHSSRVLAAVAEVRRRFADFHFDLIAGNVATREGTKALIDAGVDGVKVGIGPGSICTTRIIAGIGVPQLTAVMRCAEVAHAHDIPLIADGGIKFSGDAVKALAGGASAVMVGSVLAGTDEAPGELIIYQGKSFKSYRGMGSLGAMAQGGKDRYFQDQVETSKLVPEGIEGRVSYKGPLKDTIIQLCGGLQQGMGYLGASSIAELQARASFVQITSAGLRESHPHDVEITRESPNYKRD